MKHTRRLIFQTIFLLTAFLLFSALPTEAHTPENVRHPSQETGFQNIANSKQNDSATFFLDRIIESESNAQKENAIQEAIRYAGNKQDSLALYTFKLESCQLLFSQGKYLEFFDSMTDLEHAIASHLHRPSLLLEHRTTSFPIRSVEDSLWANLHVEAGLALATAEMYLNEYTTAADLVATIRSIYCRDSNDIVSGRCHNCTGALFAHWNMTGQAIEHFNKALAILKGKMSDTQIATLYINLASMYAVSNQPDLILKNALEAYTTLKNAGIEGEKYIYSVFYMGIAFLYMEDYESAGKYLRQALEKAEEKDFGHLAIYIRNHLARLALQTGESAIAGKLALQNLEESRKLGNKDLEESAFRFLSDLHASNGQCDESRRYLDSAYHLCSASANDSRDLKTAYLNQKFENHKQLLEKLQSEQELELAHSKIKNRNLQIVIVCISVLAACILLLVFYRRLKAQRIMNRILRLKLEQSKDAQALAHLQEDTRNLAKKDKELASMALYLYKLQGIMENLQEKIKLMKNQGSLDTKQKACLSEMESCIASSIPDKNWSEFELYFTRVDNEFFRKLEKRFPNLTPNEKRICALVHLNLSSKEIADITNRSFHSINTAKSRIKKKLGCETNQHLSDFLTRL